MDNKKILCTAIITRRFTQIWFADLRKKNSLLMWIQFTYTPVDFDGTGRSVRKYLRTSARVHLRISAREHLRISAREHLRTSARKNCHTC